MKKGGYPIDLMVDTDAEPSVMTQQVDPLSNKHTTIIGATGDRVCHLFSMAR
jgi:hypothetical protein